MSLTLIRHTLGRVFAALGLILLIPALIALRDDSVRVLIAYLGSALGLAVLGLLLSLGPRPAPEARTRDRLARSVLVWIGAILVGALPLLAAGDFPTAVDALFESASGFTNTGATVSVYPEGLSRATLFWRALMQWLGGLAILFVTFTLFPEPDMDILDAQRPAPYARPLLRRLGDAARLIYLLYGAMTLVLALILKLLGLPLFDAVLHACTTAGSGGFSVTRNSLGTYPHPLLPYVMTGAMLAFGVNFRLYLLLVLGRGRRAFSGQTLRYYLGIYGVAAALVLVTVLPHYRTLALGPTALVRDTLFTTAALMTTTGFTYTNYDAWPLITHVLLLILMFIGSCLGSTGSGLRVQRVVIGTKAALAELRRIRQPARVITVTFDGETVSGARMRRVLSYFAMFAAVFIVTLLLLAAELEDFTTAFSAVAATLSNTGPGLGLVGPTQSYAAFSRFAKVLLSAVMLAGRLDIFPLLLILHPRTWRRT